MGTFSTDFSDSGYSAGSQPPDWTLQWDAADSGASFDFDVEADASGSSHGDQVLDVTKGVANEYSALSWDDVGSPADADVKVRVRWDNSATDSFSVGVIVRGDEDSAGKYGYTLTTDISTNELELHRFDVSSTKLAGAIVNREFGNTANKWWFWLRLQVSGTSIKGKIWKDGLDEPVAWNIETTDSAVSAGGFVGVVGQDGGGQVDWFGAGTSGDAPPAEPSPEGDARVSQIVVEVLRQNTAGTQVVGLIS